MCASADYRLQYELLLMYGLVFRKGFTFFLTFSLFGT